MLLLVAVLERVNYRACNKNDGRNCRDSTGDCQMVAAWTADILSGLKINAAAFAGQLIIEMRRLAFGTFSNCCVGSGDGLHLIYPTP